MVNAESLINVSRLHPLTVLTKQSTVIYCRSGILYPNYLNLTLKKLLHSVHVSGPVGETICL